MSLISELKRRNVFKVGAAYAIVGWLLVQVADVILPTFSAPGWVMQVFTLFIALGFPLALILAWAFDMTPEGVKSASDGPPGDSIAPPSGDKLNYAILGFIALAVGFLVVDRFLLEPRSNGAAASLAPIESTARNSQVRRYSIDIGETLPLGYSQLDLEVALSPDGSTLAYAAVVPGSPVQLYIRRLDSLDTQPIPGTAGGRGPFFSPDGDWVGFSDQAAGMGMGTARYSLRKVQAGAGSPQLLSANTGRIWGSSWGNDDSLVASLGRPGGALSSALTRIPATGGAPEVLVTPPADTWHRWPQILPGGNNILFTILPRGFGENESESQSSVAVLSLDSREIRPLISSAHYARYVSSGHIVFVRDGAIWAVPFDLEAPEITGAEVPVIEGVNSHSGNGSAAYAISEDGLLTYARGGDTQNYASDYFSLAWKNRDGNEDPLEVGVVSGSHSYTFTPQLSPDGKYVAAVLGNNQSADIWVHDVTRGGLSRVTTDPGVDHAPIWSPDGQRIYFGSTREEPGIYSRAANGTDSAELVLAGKDLAPETLSPDENQLVYRKGKEDQTDIDILDLGGDSDSRPLLQTEFRESLARISPDGQWIAYVTSETGQNELYVRPYPNVEDGKWQISTGGAWNPFWSHDGQQLFFWDNSGAASNVNASLMSVYVRTEPQFSASPPTQLFDAEFGFVLGISPDGERFLVAKEASPGFSEGKGATLVFVENWFEELKRVAPVGQ